jgi:hypothetical protein
MPTLRNLIRAILVDAVPDIGERWLEQFTADQIPQKPFGLIRLDEADPGSGWGGGSQLLTASPYTDPDNLDQLDTLVAQVVGALHNRTVVDDTGTSFLLWHDRAAGRDFHDEAWQANTKPIRVRLFPLGWQSGLTSAPDPAHNLALWVQQYVVPAGFAFQTDPASWNPSDESPGLYWRILTESMPVNGRLSWGCWWDATIRGHLVAPSEATRRASQQLIARMMGQTRTIIMDDRSPLFLNEVSYDAEADPFRAGQIRLTARYGILKGMPEPSAKIQHAVTTLRLAQHFDLVRTIPLSVSVV